MSTHLTDLLPYRPCVGIALINKDGRLFVGERIDNPNAWQMPQGGIDPGETVEQAFFREMREEVGTDKAEILRIHAEKLRYELPLRLRKRLWGGQFRGQEQSWVAARFTGTDEDIRIAAHQPPEFQRWQWVRPGDLLGMIVPFKRETYREVLESFSDLINL
jgi:putative (di)nucleoside polyphosphate hydrolase